MSGGSPCSKVFLDSSKAVDLPAYRPEVFLSTLSQERLKMSLRAWRIWIPDCVSLDLHHLLLLGIFFIIIILHLRRRGSVLPYPFYIQLLIKFATALPSIRHNDKVWHVLQVFWGVNHHVLFMRYRAAEHRVHVIQPRNLKDKCHVKWSQMWATIAILIV